MKTVSLLSQSDVGWHLLYSKSLAVYSKVLRNVLLWLRVKRS